MKTGKAVVGILVGIAAGALMGMIYGAKRKGRVSISKKGQAFAEAINNRIDERFGELTNSVSSRMRGASHRTNNTLRPD